MKYNLFINLTDDLHEIPRRRRSVIRRSCGDIISHVILVKHVTLEYNTVYVGKDYQKKTQS